MLGVSSSGGLEPPKAPQTPLQEEQGDMFFEIARHAMARTVQHCYVIRVLTQPERTACVVPARR